MRRAASLSLGSCLALALASCGPAGFNDHTVARIDSEQHFTQLAVGESTISAAKIIITSFNSTAARDTLFFDSQFYKLHDEWYWFRLLNAQPIPGDDVMPVRGLSFSTIRDVYTWASAQRTLPLDLQIFDGRLYSWRFYNESFGAARRYGLATLMRIAPRNSGEQPRWAFELEFSDNVTHPQIVTFFDSIMPRLPAAIAGQLKWLVRSAEQETLAQTMERDHLPYWDRILRYRDVVIPGTREVYSDGITAGYLRFIHASDGMPNTNANEILVFERMPDFLPAAAGVVTAVPQTPLAHINLLARNRGIPNAHIAGALEDPSLTQIARGYSPAVYFAAAPNNVVIAPITGEQYNRYVALSTRPVRSVNTPDTSALPYLIDLSTRTPDEIPMISPIIGGKAVGYVALLAEANLELPLRPHSLTVRAYVEHLAPMRARISAALADAEFERDVRVREVVLDGIEVFLTRHTTDADRTWVGQFTSTHLLGNPLGDLARTGGIRGLVQNTPIAPATLATIHRELSAIYSQLAVTQGLRFRSSSNVEDIEGFNGAGLYESYTGFLDPAAQPRTSDQSKTIEKAIRQVWGSFWGFEAFEERRSEHIDHLSSAMAVVVHPRFDDALERATGVTTLTITPPNDSDDVRLEVNVQKGAESVANPNPDILPEVVRVIRHRSDGAIRIERVRRSSLSPNEDLLGDAALRKLFDDALSVSQHWLTRENAARAAAQAGRTLTLDFEFHDMLAGWPALRDGSTRPARLVLKQARTLEPGPRTVMAEAQTWPIPRDIFTRARRIFIERCDATIEGATVRAELMRVLTDTSLPPDVGFATTAFDAQLRIAAQGAAPASLGWASNASFTADHTQLETARDETGFSANTREMTPARMGFDRATLSASHTLSITRGVNTVSAQAMCTTELLYASPRDYLLSLLPTQ
ncbi:MAG: PEP/pyruvate-binding domain-containing protein [Polyangiales bacterium]